MRNSNWIEVQIPGTSVQTVCVAQVVITYCKKAGLRWINSTKDCPLSEPTLTFTGAELVAKHPVVGLATDAEEYDVATGHLSRAVTFIYSLQSSTAKLSGPRKMPPFLRDSYEVVLEAYHQLCIGDTAEFSAGQQHLRGRLRIPGAYKVGDETVVGLHYQKIITSVISENDVKMVQQMVCEAIASNLRDFAKRVVVFDMANRFAVPVQNFVKAGLVSNADAVVAAANERLVANLYKGNKKSVKKNGEGEDIEDCEEDGEKFVMTEPSSSSKIQNCYSYN